MWRMVTAGILVLVTLATGVGDAGGAGITTHRWMAEVAIDRVTVEPLRALLETNLDMVQTGAGFPDVGYAGDNTYGETAHWQRFVDNLVDAIAHRSDCGDVSDPTGACAPLIAFTFGVAAHGMGDEVFDWLFEPNSPDRDEYFTGVPTANEGGAETQMDLVAILRYGVERPMPGTVPDEAMVLDAFTASGQPGVTASEFALVEMLPMLWDVEKGWADQYLADVEAAMPWMSANLVIAPGGVAFAATAIAGYWESEWGRLLGDQPATRVSVTYPAPGQTGVPATGWDRVSFQPGSDRGRGGARNRITAALTSARPYLGASGGVAVSDQLPDGSMTITDLGTGEQVPLKSGYPRSVPYGSDSGEHLIDTQPAGDLAMCTWYRVDVSGATPVVDARGLSVTPYAWQFRTECDRPDPPTTDPPATAPPATTVPATPSPPTVTAIPGTTIPPRDDSRVVPSALTHGTPAAPRVSTGATGREAPVATPVEHRAAYTG